MNFSRRHECDGAHDDSTKWELRISFGCRFRDWTCRFMGDLNRVRFAMGFFSGDGNGQSFQAVVTGHKKRATVQNVFNEISNLFQVRVGEACKEMIRYRALTSASRQENCGKLCETPDENRALRSDDLGAHVIAVNSLHVGFDISDCALL